jgi:hypothetical protein
MKKASEYREHARECRALAAQMLAEEQRQQLLQMADHWEKLAEDRMTLIGKHPELAIEGEQEEVRTWRTQKGKGAGARRAKTERPDEVGPVGEE